MTPAPILLEVCVETLASAVAAEQGGAHRVELCSNLAVEGVTPSLELIEQVRRRISIPLHDLHDFSRVRFRKRSAEHSEVLCKEKHQAALDSSVTCDESIAVKPLLSHAEVAAAMRN